MCGRGRRRRGGSDAAVAGSGGRGFCATALAVVALAAAAAVAFLESTAGGVAYAGDGWLHECAKWDAEGGRFLVSTFFGAGVAEVRVGAGTVEERVIVADPDVAGRVALGLAVDAPRRRILVAYADRPPRFGYAAVGAYDLGSGRRIFLARLDGPGESSFADDVAADEDGNVYVTDVKGSKIWKVSPDGEPLPGHQERHLHPASRNAGQPHRPERNRVSSQRLPPRHPHHRRRPVQVDPKTGAMSVVKVLGSLKRGDGLELLSPTRLAVAGMPTRLVDSSDDWETARVTGRYVGPAHRVGVVGDGEGRGRVRQPHLRLRAR
ncbi:hypothetical protein ACQ4PT_050298 [Festuca glaucescens]